MKKAYLAPQYEYILISADDVLTNSPGNVSVVEPGNFWGIEDI